VGVEVFEKGFLISVFMDKNSPGLLASILKAFDVLGLTVLEVRASCAGSFRLQAVGGEVFTKTENKCTSLIIRRRGIFFLTDDMLYYGCYRMVMK
jgi:hypothetical protein